MWTEVEKNESWEDKHFTAIGQVSLFGLWSNNKNASMQPLKYMHLRFSANVGSTDIRDTVKLN